MSTTNAQIGHRIRQYRQLNGMSLSALAALLGITYQQLQKYENGRDRISAARLAVVADVLGLPVQAFYCDPGKEDERLLSLTQLEFRLIQLLRTLPAEHQNALFIFISNAVTSRK